MMQNFQQNELRSFASDLLKAGGFSVQDAVKTADLLVWANLRGADSHGVLRIPRYIEMIEKGLMTSGGDVDIVRSFGAISVLDGGKCPGVVGMNAAADVAAALAASYGIGWCAVRNISHTGAIGYFTSALAAKRLVGIAFAASKPLMSYFGAKREALSTNPLSIAFPGGSSKDPILLDMSTAAVALGKIMAAKDAGSNIPEGWAIDEDGQSTTDPSKVASLLPMAGAKGSGLSLMIEMLTSVMAGNAVIGPVLAGLKAGGFNGTVIAVDPIAFGEPDVFAAEITRLVDAIHALEPVEGNDRVRLPGERGAETARRRLVEGIPLAKETTHRLFDLARSLGVATPDRRTYAS